MLPQSGCNIVAEVGTLVLRALRMYTAQTTNRGANSLLSSYSQLEYQASCVGPKSCSAPGISTHSFFTNDAGNKLQVTLVARRLIKRRSKILLNGRTLDCRSNWACNWAAWGFYDVKHARD